MSSDISVQLSQLAGLVQNLVQVQMAQSQSAPKPINFVFEEFKSIGEETISSYFDRFKLQLQLSGIPEASWANYVRVHMGAELSNLLRETIYPETPEKMSYAAITEYLIGYFKEKTNKYSEAIKFRKIIQDPNESVADYARKLKVGARDCEFGNFLDYSLIVQFIHGVKDDCVRDAVVMRKPDKFSDALKLAEELESTKQASLEIKFQSADKLHKFAHASRPRSSSRSRSHVRRRSSSRSRTSHRSQDRDAPMPSKCYGCGENHWRKDCPFRSSICPKCSRAGHLAKVCGNSRRFYSRKNYTRQISEEINSPNSLRQNFISERSSDFQPTSAVTYFGEDESYNCVGEISIAKRPPPAMVTVMVNGKPLQMELDTGGVCSMVNKDTLTKIIPDYKLSPTSRTFVSYTKDRFQCLGYVSVNVTFRQRTRSLNLYVTPFHTDNIFGREWISEFADLLTFEEFFKISESIPKIPSIPDSKLSSSRLDSILQKFDGLFSEVAGTLVGPPADCTFRENFQPKFARARPVPFALRDAFAAEIDKKIASGHYRQVSSSEWASPIHIVMKGSKMRLTGDYKATLNPQLVVDEYPIPRVEELFHKLGGATKFSRLDITDAYMSLPCSDRFCQAMTLNTPTHGLVQPTRAQYGVANIPALWARRMESILQGLDCTLNFFDDLIVFSNSDDGMFRALQNTFERLQQAGLKLRRSKCAFLLEQVDFLGHSIDASGVHPLHKHVDALLNTLIPRTPAELRTFLGKVNYYHAFIPNLSTVTAPLRSMLTAQKFTWTKEGKHAYDSLKRELVSDRVLMPYDPKLPLLLATDASPVGLGAVLSHVLPDGSERPISFASKSLTETERRYPQIDREALAIVWGVKRWFPYVYARKFTILTDNKPVSHIFAPKATLPQFTLSRCANYAAYLANFNYEIKYKPSTQNCNTDFLSRSPHLNSKKETALNSVTGKLENTDSFDDFIQMQISQTPLTSREIAAETRKDPHLSAILQAVHEGRDLVACGFKGNESEYSSTDGCLMFGHRVVIPPKFQRLMLEELHTAHLGMVKMKGLARSLVYWPSIDHDIESIAKSCAACLKNSKLPPKLRSHHWEYPKGPWERIHLDYAGPLFGKFVFVIIDAYSKWMSVHITNSSTAEATCKMLESTFSQFGVPIVVVSDNGPQFTAEYFKNFLRQQGVRFHKTSAVHHPSTNGQAERGIQTLKRALSAAGASPNSLQHCINAFLLQYHKAPHVTTGQPPSLLFLGRIIRSRMDEVKPDLKRRMDDRGLTTRSSNFRVFSPGDRVMFRNYRQNSEFWQPGVIVTKLGELHYEVDSNGQRHKRHLDQLQADGSAEADAPAPEVDYRRRVRIFGALPPETPHCSAVEVAPGRRSSVQPMAARSPPSSSQGGSSPPNPIRHDEPSHVAAPQVQRYPKRARQPRKIYTAR